MDCRPENVQNDVEGMGASTFAAFLRSSISESSASERSQQKRIHDNIYISTSGIKRIGRDGNVRARTGVVTPLEVRHCDEKGKKKDKGRSLLDVAPRFYGFMVFFNPLRPFSASACLSKRNWRERLENAI
ncbi:hypothetical protein QLX08_010975 [Tetragonisca angustula]|uniref:Uncharacterized protein n=1 Tax=Tetragonisca angustula TaxID=166442 RepID=A0AAW0ZA12_9HYME